jgi:ammonia channel protein AmtB
VSDRTVIHTMLLSFSAFASISFTWSLLGYSLAFSVNPSSAWEPWVGGTHFGAGA